MAFAERSGEPWGPLGEGEHIRLSYGFRRLCAFPCMTRLCVLRISVSVQPHARLISLHFVSLCFILLHSAHNAVFKNKLKVCSQPVSSESIGASLPTARAHLLLLCLSLVILQRFKPFHYDYICYGDLWPVVFDVTVIIVLGMPKNHAHIRWQM